MGSIKKAFEDRVQVLPLSALVPSKQVTAGVRNSAKFRQITASIAAVGIIEPIVVAPAQGQPGQYMILDGNLRFTVLHEAGTPNARCLIACDDEAFTYNKRINRLATIQEHLMIVKAIERGVSEDKLALALNLDVRAIRRRRMMLVGICPEVVDLLKDKRVNPNTFGVLRKMKPMRQIEAAELMAVSGNFTASYAKALFAATRQSDLIKSDKPKRVGDLSPDQMAKMEREMERLQQGMKGVEATYGDDVLHLVVATGYLNKLLSNKAINRYLGQHHPELQSEFSSIVSVASVGEP